MLFKKIDILHKSGFVNIVGNPNVGKSTLMNCLTGEKLSIITFKEQTTRHRIMGIVNTNKVQIVYSDTPGVLYPYDKLQKQMMHFSESALLDADILLYTTDVTQNIGKNIFFLRRIQESSVPVILIINKVDLSTQTQLEKIVTEWEKVLPHAEIIPLSVLYSFRISYLKHRIESLLPKSPPYFDKCAITDRPAKFFVSEIIREKILLYYQKEVPYSAEVVVECFDESENFIKIIVIIVVERNSQKGIIIGRKGLALKKIGVLARQEIEKFFLKKVFIKMVVQVEKNWKNKENLLKGFGYK